MIMNLPLSWQNHDHITPLYQLKFNRMTNLADKNNEYLNITLHNGGATKTGYSNGRDHLLAKYYAKRTCSLHIIAHHGSHFNIFQGEDRTVFMTALLIT